MNELDKALDEANRKEPPCRCVVRLTTSAWKSKRGVHLQQSLLVLARKSVGFNILMEDADNIDPIDLMSKIVNLSECKDGIYTLETCNETRDWETGHIDDYDYKLIPFGGAA